MGRVLLFDVNETLLDLGVLDQPFEDLFGAGGVRREWFARLLHLSTVVTALGKYVDLSDLAVQALDATAAAHDVELTSGERESVTSRLRSLPPHPDVAEGLGILADAGFRMAALTNSGLATARARLEDAGIADKFERILSAETTALFKPHPQPYRDAAEALGVDVETLRVVAAHDWDCAGALGAGAVAAFLARPGQTYAEALAPVDLSAEDLPALARLIAAEDEPEST